MGKSKLVETDANRHFFQCYPWVPRIRSKFEFSNSTALDFLSWLSFLSFCIEQFRFTYFGTLVPPLTPINPPSIPVAIIKSSAILHPAIFWQTKVSPQLSGTKAMAPLDYLTLFNPLWSTKIQTSVNTAHVESNHLCTRSSGRLLISRNL